VHETPLKPHVLPEVQYPDEPQTRPLQQSALDEHDVPELPQLLDRQ
jgi:hypothetical protein